MWRLAAVGAANKVLELPNAERLFPRENERDKNFTRHRENSDAFQLQEVALGKGDKF